MSFYSVLQIFNINQQKFACRPNFGRFTRWWYLFCIINWNNKNNWKFLIYGFPFPLICPFQGKNVRKNDYLFLANLKNTGLACTWDLFGALNSVEILVFDEIQTNWKNSVKISETDRVHCTLESKRCSRYKTIYKKYLSKNNWNNAKWSVDSESASKTASFLFFAKIFIRPNYFYELLFGFTNIQYKSAKICMPA